MVFTLSIGELCLWLHWNCLLVIVCVRADCIGLCPLALPRLRGHRELPKFKLLLKCNAAVKVHYTFMVKRVAV